MTTEQILDELKVEALAGSSWTNLYLSCGRLEKENPKDVLEDVKLLTRKDIIEKGREIKYPNCRHKNTYMIKVCQDCGKSWKVYQDN